MGDAVKEKIREGLQKGKYRESGSGGYINAEAGWTDYLISERIIFSHRINDYSAGDLLEELHAHGYYELTLNAAGEGVQYISDGQGIVVEPGMAILTKPLKFHVFRLDAPICYDRYVLYFRDPSAVFPDCSVMDFVGMGNDSFAAFALSGQRLLTQIRAAEAALSDEDTPYAMAKAYLEICGLFLTLSDQKTISARSVHPPQFISCIKEYIDANFLQIHSVSDVAAHFFYSREYISRSFRQYYNTPVYEYILKRKILYCCMLLEDGENVETAARSAGFGNMSSFIKVFRRTNGCTPSEYRAKTR